MKFDSDSSIQKRIQAWIEGPFDPDTKEEIRRLLQQNPKELEEAFFKNLSFGTGGMRGLMGVGTNRMNIYTVRSATQGLANYLKKQPGENHSVFIGYDVRDHSKQFAEEAGRVLAGNGIRALISREICPTPLVSFSCRHLSCSAGIMITASHNPPAYNGYKVYWSDGSQIVAPHDVGIMEEVERVDTISLDSLNSPYIQWIGREIDTAYFAQLKKLQLHPEAHNSDLHILYTNLHGTGIRMIPDALHLWGFTSVALVESQAAPDGTFCNAPSPNPEEEKTLAIGTRELLESKKDLLLATDPDADRMGVVVRKGDNGMRITGNQIACLCLHHICTSLTNKGVFPPNAAFIKTIVTTELFKKIATSFGGTCIDVLTGFKYIGEKIRVWENSFGGLQFVFGAEESYGYLFGTFVRDKDAISSCCLIAEAASIAKTERLTLVDLLYKIYQEYGIHRESLTNLVFSDSKESLDQITKLMKRLRSHPPASIGGQPIERIEDFYQKTLDLPKSDVLRFWLADGSKLVIRPSGTEPKVKIYAEVAKTTEGSLEKDISDCDRYLKHLVEAFRTDCFEQ